MVYIFLQLLLFQIRNCMNETGEENPYREPSFSCKQESKDQTRAESPKCPNHGLMSSLNIRQIRDDIHFPIIV